MKAQSPLACVCTSQTWYPSCCNFAYGLTFVVLILVDCVLITPDRSRPWSVRLSPSFLHVESSLFTVAAPAGSGLRFGVPGDSRQCALSRPFCTRDQSVWGKIKLAIPSSSPKLLGKFLQNTYRCASSMIKYMNPQAKLLCTVYSYDIKRTERCSSPEISDSMQKHCQL